MSDATIGRLVAHAGTALVAGQYVLFYSFVLRARLELGRWPYPYHPDPKDLGFTLHHALVWLGWFSMMLAPLLAGVGYFTAEELGVGARARRASAVIFVVLYLGGVALFLADPWSYGEWFAD